MGSMPLLVVAVTGREVDGAVAGADACAFPREARLSLLRPGPRGLTGAGGGAWWQRLYGAGGVVQAADTGQFDFIVEQLGFAVCGEDGGGLVQPVE
ncbi:hypothetical protein SAMN05421870_10359 [Streptomyces qinglanensis]|uniref:Uncharacterized protein n=1 Tax=Streptomyces qinglanensis TaxID=943816 RepID=A0A1H9QQZ9_9ACTN|nr:hypothetical protein SAMN05421870_10359 [Streptomyces qinglanensis]